MILAEHLYQPIRGRVVTIGRNGVGLTGEDMDRLLASMGVPKRPDTRYQVDHDTVLRQRETITQESFFAAFSDAEVLALDVSAYEKAGLILDLQDKLPRRYRGFADFIYDGGSLDDIFDVAGSLRNISRMLKPGGRFLAKNNGGQHPTSYLKYSADWFMDFFAFNNYADCKVYICNYPGTHGVQLKRKLLRTGPYQSVVYNFNPYVEHATGVGYDCSSIESVNRYEIYCLAEKGRQSTDDRNPIRKHYRTDPGHNKLCNSSAKRFLNSPRPVFFNPVPFDPAEIPRIDSSDYPEQIKPVAVLTPQYIDEVRPGAGLSA
jgi:hypothetical protein